MRFLILSRSVGLKKRKPKKKITSGLGIGGLVLQHHQAKINIAEKLFDVVEQLTQHGKIKESTTETPMQHKNGLSKSLVRSDDAKRRKRGWPNFLHDFFLKNTLVAIKQSLGASKDQRVFFISDFL